MIFFKKVPIYEFEVNISFITIYSFASLFQYDCMSYQWISLNSQFFFLKFDFLCLIYKSCFLFNFKNITFYQMSKINLFRSFLISILIVEINDYTIYINRDTFKLVWIDELDFNLKIKNCIVKFLHFFLEEGKQHHSPAHDENLLYIMRIIIYA
jgi:hypothetical protein